MIKEKKSVGHSDTNPDNLKSSGSSGEYVIFFYVRAIVTHSKAFESLYFSL